MDYLLPGGTAVGVPELVVQGLGTVAQEIEIVQTEDFVLVEFGKYGSLIDGYAADFG